MIINKYFGIYINRWGNWFTLLPTVEISIRHSGFTLRFAWGFWGLEITKRRNVK